MMELHRAACAVGDEALAKKFEEGAKSLRHGVVFATSPVPVMGGTRCAAIVMMCRVSFQYFTEVRTGPHTTASAW